MIRLYQSVFYLNLSFHIFFVGWGDVGEVCGEDEEGLEPGHEEDGDDDEGDDLPDLAGASGFDVLHQGDHELPYLQSPLNRGKRYELVHTLIAQRTEAKVNTEAEPVMPSWLHHPTEIVPLSEEFRTQLTTTRIHAFIMGLIDGKRSIDDMAKVLEEQRLMPQQQGVAAVRQFLSTMHQEAMTQRRTR